MRSKVTVRRACEIKSNRATGKDVNTGKEGGWPVVEGQQRSVCD